MPDDYKAKPDLSALRIKREDWEGRGRGGIGKKLLWVIIPVVLIVILLAVFGGFGGAIEVSTAPAVTLTRTQSLSVLSATGYVVAERQAAVASKGTGRLEFLGVEEGDTVAQGEVIGRIENADMMAALEAARAGLDQAQAESLEATFAFNRQKSLIESGSTTREAYEIGEVRLMRAMAGVRSARAAIKSAEVSLENTFIRAPFDGTVLAKHADVGEVVAPFASSATSKGSVVDLADMSSLEVEADVSEANIQKVAVGQPCEIILDAYPGVRYQGRVKKIVPTADRSRATVLTKVAFIEIDSRVLPEMSARVNFLESDSAATAASSDSTIAVPTSALVTIDGRRVVFLAENGQARMTDVAAGKNVGNLTEIQSGLASGQRVVTSPPATLKDGDKIKVVE